MSGWGAKRPDHRKWPQPTRPQDDALILLAAKFTVFGLALTRPGLQRILDSRSVLATRRNPGSRQRAGRPASLYDQTLGGKLSRAVAAAVLRA
jgi:hypothetical protein